MHNAMSMFITADDMHELCVICLGAEHAQSALKFTVRKLCSCLAHFRGMEARLLLSMDRVLLLPRQRGSCGCGDHRWSWLSSFGWVYLYFRLCSPAPRISCQTQKLGLRMDEQFFKPPPPVSLRFIPWSHDLIMESHSQLFCSPDIKLCKHQGCKWMWVCEDATGSPAWYPGLGEEVKETNFSICPRPDT